MHSRRSYADAATRLLFGMLSAEPSAVRTLLSVALMLAPASAGAAGLFLSPRGVRPLARAGAYVAGADDPNALSYNPAGLALSPAGILVDAALPLITTQYTRRVYADSRALTPVTAHGLNLPNPTIAAADGLGLAPGLMLGLGVAADYPLMQNWPTKLEDGSPAPQRYAIYGYAGTEVMKVTAAAGYKLGEHLTLGAALHLLTGAFASQVALSTCDGAFCTQPENHDYDATIQMVARSIVALGGSLGLVVLPADWLRFGLAWESGYTIDSDAELQVRLPSAPIYDNAYVEPRAPRGQVSLALPMQLRAGAEVRLLGARLEAALVYEPWSVHDKVRIDTRGLLVRGVQNLDDYHLPPVALEQGFRDTWSVRLGGEARVVADLTMRGGLMYEPSAVPKDKITAMNVDLDKLILAFGCAYALREIKLEATYAHVFMAGVTVTNSSIHQTNSTGWTASTPVGNGTYASRADIFGLGVGYTW
jgi:long-chain fatty acid transport protein